MFTARTEQTKNSHKLTALDRERLLALDVRPADFIQVCVMRCLEACSEFRFQITISPSYPAVARVVGEQKAAEMISSWCSCEIENSRDDQYQHCV